MGVEYTIDNDRVEDVKALVDRVRNFTNLFVVDSLGITQDLDTLDEVCDYVYDAGLCFLVFLIGPVSSTGHLRYNYYLNPWILTAKERYSDKLLRVYVLNEPGGHQLDAGSLQFVKETKDEAEAAEIYVDLLNSHIDYYTFLQRYEDYTVLNADYGLYWFDYKSGYDAFLVEFAWNDSRPLNLALCRGAAKVQKREWDVMITWTYERPPYLVSGSELYDDLILAYHTGAKYAVVFDYPETDYIQYGILTEEHFQALEPFWNYMNNNRKKRETAKAEVAYVLPENYGFGFRSAEDNFWGIWNADEDARSEMIWNDVNQIIDEYGFSLDIVGSDPEFNSDLQQYYKRVIFWSDTQN